MRRQHASVSCRTLRTPCPRSTWVSFQHTTSILGPCCCHACAVPCSPTAGSRCVTAARHRRVSTVALVSATKLLFRQQLRVAASIACAGLRYGGSSCAEVSCTSWSVPTCGCNEQNSPASGISPQHILHSRHLSLVVWALCMYADILRCPVWWLVHALLAQAIG